MAGVAGVTSPSIRSLLAANAVTLAAALAFEWPLGWLLWPYWIQSVLVGWYARKRMLELQRFSTKGLSANGRAVPETAEGKRSIATFFALHYGLFHAGYLVFLTREHAVAGAVDVLALIACGISFALSQRQAWAVQHAADLRGCPNLGTLTFLPYLRIVPMHAAIIFGTNFGDSGEASIVLLFVGLKTAADVGMDVVDRRLAMRAAERVGAADAEAAGR